MAITPTMGGGVVQRISGLYVPESATERTILADDWRQLRRFFRLAKQHQMIGAFFCKECKQPIAGSNEDRLVQGLDGKAMGGRIVLKCSCTRWSVK